MTINMESFIGKRRVIRAPVNPLDKSTVFSIYPKRIKEIKPTIQPGIFEIAPGTYENPSRLVVGSSSWWKEIDIDQPHLEIPQGSIVVAKSIVFDYCNGLLEYKPDFAMPGLFYVPGELTVEDLKNQYLQLLTEAETKQRNWYKALVDMADSLWARTGGNPRSISEDMRMAAIELQLDKAWIKDFNITLMENCPVCGALWNPIYPLCSNCHTVLDNKKYSELGLSKENAKSK